MNRMKNRAHRFVNLAILVFVFSMSFSSLSFSDEGSDDGENFFSRAWHFWVPKVEPTVAHWFRTAEDYWVPHINDEYLPAIRNVYARLGNRFGPAIAHQYRVVMDYWGPILDHQEKIVTDYWYSRNPAYFDRWARVPAPVKKAVDHVISHSLLSLGAHGPDAQVNSQYLPERLRRALETYSKMMIPTKDVAFQNRLDWLVERLRYSAVDSEMIHCYQAIGLESTIHNAFNTGCTIFVSRSLAELLNDNELRAVLAHEMSHGDQGHLVKNIGLLGSSMGGYFTQLVSEDTVWILTGEVGPVLGKVISDGNMNLIIDRYSTKAPAIEIAADQGGVGILERAGFKRQSLKDALTLLYGYQPGDVIPPQEDEVKSLRNYPSLYSRLQAIDRAVVTR